MRKIFAVLFFLSLFLGCSSDNGGEPTPPTTGNPDPEPPKEVTFDRGDMLVNWADNIIIPSYEAFDTQLKSLVSSFDSFKANANSDNLTALRSTWVETYKSWQYVSMFEIGPAETIGYRLNMNIYPTDTEKIDGFVTSGNYDFSLPSNRAAKGFPALDYLLNGLDTEDEAIVSKYNGADSDALLNYFEAVLEDMQTLTSSVISEWKNGYRDTFVANDGSSATASVDRFVNDFIFYYEKFLRAGKMGIPLGVFSRDPLPGNVEAFYESEVSNQLFLEGLQAVQDLFNGKHFATSTTGESLASYLDELNTLKEGEDLKAIINNQFDKARELVSALGAFRAEIENNDPPTDMLLAYDEVQRVVPLLKVDMVSAMSIGIDFVDADGD